jgi:hypothetical protein
MNAENLLDSSKTELCEKLKAVEAASRQWRAVLSCQIKGIGRFDPSACRQAQSDLEDALEEAQAIYADTVEPVGLLRGTG